MGQTTTNQAEAENRADIYQRVTDSIVAAIEAGAGKWQMPWHSGADGLAPVLPVNVTTGRPYRGVNTVVLWASAQEQAYGSAVWGTYRQWQERGAQVRKSEQASPVVFWKITERGESDDSSDDQEDNRGGRRFFARGYSVFNAAQVDGFEVPSPACYPRRSGSSVPRRSLPDLALPSSTAETGPSTARSRTASRCRPSLPSPTRSATTPRSPMK